MPYDVEALRTVVLQFRDRYEQFGAHEGAHALTRVLNLLDAAPDQPAARAAVTEPAPAPFDPARQREP